MCSSDYLLKLKLSKYLTLSSTHIFFIIVYYLEKNISILMDDIYNFRWTVVCAALTYLVKF